MEILWRKPVPLTIRDDAEAIEIEEHLLKILRRESGNVTESVDSLRFLLKEIDQEPCKTSHAVL